MEVERVILVNEKDEAIGLMEKMEAHRKAELHRAFSVFIFNDEGQMLIHQRAKSKYHSGGLWTNACCSHPRENETIEEAAHRRLVEEMGFDTEVQKKFNFIYRAELDHGLTEHELDHVLVGIFNDEPTPNPEEVEDWKYVDMVDLILDVKDNPRMYTEWFKIALAEIQNRDLLTPVR